jgi:HPt (histidine-containing phosphotransfer) domain-containing protein
MEITFDKQLDGAFLAELYQGDATYAAAVFGTFLEEVHPMMEDCRQTIVRDDILAFQKAVHKLKPTLSYVGLTALWHKLEQIEKGCSAAGASLQVLAGNYGEAEAEIKNMLPLIEIEKTKLETLN